MNFIRFSTIFGSIGTFISSIALILISAIGIYVLGELAKYILKECKVNYEGKWYIKFIPVWDIIIAFIFALAMTKNVFDGIINGVIVGILSVYAKNIDKLIMNLIKKENK